MRLCRGCSSGCGARESEDGEYQLQALQKDAEAMALLKRMNEQGVLTLCTMLNNLYAAEEKLSSLWQQIANGWRRAVGARWFTASCSRQGVIDSTQAGGRACCYIATRLVAWDLRSELSGNLYLPSAVSRLSRCTTYFEKVISEKSSELVD